MSFHRLVPFRASALALLIACSTARAQIHEEATLPGLEAGIVFWSGSDPVQNGTRHPELFHPISPADEAGTGDFSLSLFAAVGSASANEEQIVAKHNGKSGWKLVETSEGALKFIADSGLNGDAYLMETPPRVVAGRKNPHIVVSIHRDARQPYSGIWVDGVEVASGMMPPISLSTPGTEVLCGNAFVPVDLRIYNRALTRPEILDLMLLRSGDKPKPKHPVPPPGGPRFIPQQDETIALIGGTEAVALAESGELEALLLMAFPQTRFHFRCLAWEGDTVFRQDRPMNFGSLEQQLRRVNAGAVFVMFGRQECLDAAQATRSGDWQSPTKAPSAKPQASEASKNGAARAGKDGDYQSPLLEFKTAFEKLLATVEKVTPNIVVIGPWDFERKAAPFPDLREVNQVLIHSYAPAMGEICHAHQIIFANEDELMQSPKEPWTRDGVTFTRYGLRLMTDGISMLLNMRVTESAVAQGPTDSPLISATRAKNRLWHDYWRPSNWAFLHGDRTNQPSSRDPVNPQLRFFPAEQEKYLPLIKDAEDKVFNLVQEAQKKLP